MLQSLAEFCGPVYDTPADDTNYCYRHLHFCRDVVYTWFLHSSPSCDRIRETCDSLRGAWSLDGLRHSALSGQRKRTCPWVQDCVPTSGLYDFGPRSCAASAALLCSYIWADSDSGSIEQLNRLGP